MSQKNKNRYGLGRQFTLVLAVAVFLLALLLAGGEYFIPAYFAQRGAANNLAIAKVAALRLEQALEQNAQAASRIASWPGVISLDQGQQQASLDIAVQANPEIKELFIITNEGIISAASPPTATYESGRSFANAAYFREARETGKPVFSDVFIEGDDVQVVVAVPIKMPDGSTAGTLNAVLSLKDGIVADYLNRLKIGKTGYAVLVDKRGTLMWHPDMDRVMRQENLRKHDTVRNVVAGETGSDFCDMEGDNRLCAYLPLRASGWGLIINRPVDEALPNLMLIRIIFGVIVLFGLIIVALFYWYGSKSVIKPMRTLLDGVKEAAAGNFDYRADIKKPAEVAELGNAINVMMNVMATYSAVSGALNSIANLQDMEKYVLEKMSELLQTEAGAIVRFDDEGVLNISVHKGYDESLVDAHNAALVDVSGMEYMFGAQTVTALRRGEMITLDVNKIKSLEKIVPSQDIEKVYLFPLIVLGNLDGVLLALTKSGVTFDENQLQGVKGIVGQMSVAIHRSELYERLYQSYAQTTRAIARAIDAKDPYNRGHSEGVAVMAVNIAQRMGLNVEEVRGVEIAAYLHDVGKIGVSESVLNKPAQLSEEERALVQQHPNIGTEILEPIDFPWPVIGAIESHHERFNGEGYPLGLAGEQIPLEARILAVADAYESMISDRPYRSALNLKEIIKEFARESGRQFDARVVSAFLDVLQKDQEQEAELEQNTSGDLVKTQQEEVEGQEVLPLPEEEDVEDESTESIESIGSMETEETNTKEDTDRDILSLRGESGANDEATSSDTESDEEPEEGDVA